MGCDSQKGCDYTHLFPRRARERRLTQTEIKRKNLFLISHGVYSTRKICLSEYPQRFQRAPIKKRNKKVVDYMLKVP